MMIEKKTEKIQNLQVLTLSEAKNFQREIWSTFTLRRSDRCRLNKKIYSFPFQKVSINSFIFFYYKLKIIACVCLFCSLIVNPIQN
jgi:hypothetical protein